MNCVIRPETPNDVAAIEAATAGALSVSLVAEAEGNVLGHVAVSPVTISDGTPGWYGLGPISVLPAWQGAGRRIGVDAGGA
jgi:putative acetyltransferase